MTEQLSFESLTSPPQPRRRTPAAKPLPKNPAKQALAAYTAGDLDTAGAALDEAWTSQPVEIRDPVRGSGDYTVLSDFLTSLHTEVPAWISKASILSLQEQNDAAERCADLIASGADGMFAANRKTRATKPGGLPAEPQPGEIRAAVAEALGILAHRPGGITFSGQHWCTTPHNGCPGTWDVRFEHLHQVEITTSGRKAQGAHFTPRSLAEEVSERALQAKVYSPGPNETRCCTAEWTQGHTCTKPAWRLKPSSELLALRTADIAVGAGVFLLASARYLAARVLEAWQAEGDPRTGDRGEALRLVIGGCLYGVDVNPWSVELAKLSLALLIPQTVAPDIDRHIIAGDALLGVRDLDQIRWMDLVPERGRQLHDVPRPYTAIVGEFTDVVASAMGQARPDLRLPEIWGLFKGLCDLVTAASLVASSLSQTAAKVHMLQAARVAHDLLTIDQSWRPQEASAA